MSELDTESEKETLIWNIESYLGQPHVLPIF